jgi:curved DNA-binding protein CbpA
MKDQLNYYQILHVAPDAPLEIIRSSYRTLMQKLRMHPDLGGDRDAAARINRAYNTLANPQQRAAYDRSHYGHDFDRMSAANDPAELPAPAGGAQCVFCGSDNSHREEMRSDRCYCCDSPLKLSSFSVTEVDGRRTINRLARSHPVQLWTQWPQQPYSAETADISLGGMKLISPRWLANDQVVKIQSPVLAATGRVMRCAEERDAWGVGVQFLSLHFEKVRGSFVAERV